MISCKEKNIYSSPKAQSYRVVDNFQINFRFLGVFHCVDQINTNITLKQPKYFIKSVIKHY